MFDSKAAHAPQRIPGISGRALRFDGKGQYWEAPPKTPGLDVGESNFTIELWLRPQLQSGAVNVVDKRSDLPLGYLIFVYQGFPGFQLANGNHGNVFSQSKNIADGRWHHFAAVAKRLPASPYQLFVDGAPAPTPRYNVAQTNLDVPDPLWLGRHHKNGRVNRDDIYFAGDIDELAIFRRALTAQEIQSIYRAGSKGKCRSK
jgi:hypothetical protein